MPVDAQGACKEHPRWKAGDCFQRTEYVFPAPCPCFLTIPLGISEFALLRLQKHLSILHMQKLLTANPPALASYFLGLCQKGTRSG